MPSPLIRALAVRSGIATVDEATLDAALDAIAARGQTALLFFTGDPVQRSEANDVAVVLPELLAAFPGRLSALMIARDAEEKLKARFNVVVMPSLAVVRGSTPLGVFGRIRDWAEYCEKLEAWLRPDAPAMRPSTGPKVSITHNGQEIGA